MQQGFDGLEPSHPYMTIAAETEAFAHTNYPGIPAANAVENARPLLSPVQQKAWKEMQAKGVKRIQSSDIVA